MSIKIVSSMSWKREFTDLRNAVMSSVSVGNIDSNNENENDIIGPEISRPSKKKDKLRIKSKGFGVTDCAKRSPTVDMNEAESDFVSKGLFWR